MRRFILSLKNKPEPTKELQELYRLGTMRHEEYQKEIKTIEEYGYREFRKDLHLGKTITLKEVKVCSSRFALHGIIDILTLKFEDGIIKVFITELKSGFSKTHYIQVATYTRILSDLKVKLIYEQPMKRKNKKKRIFGHLYPGNFMSLEVKGRIHVFGTPDLQNYWEMITNSQYIAGAGEIALYVMKKKREYQELMEQKAVDLCHIPYCKGCGENKKMNSCAWKYVCSRYIFLPKENQLHYGKKQLLVKNKVYGR